MGSESKTAKTMQWSRHQDYHVPAKTEKVTTEQKIEKLRCTPLSPAQTLTRMTHPPIFPFAHHVLPVIKNIGLELGSDLCDYSNAYIVVKGITTV